MNVFIAADDNYIYPAKVMLTSFLTNNKEEMHHIYFMHTSVKPEHIQALMELTHRYQAEFHPVWVNAKEFDGFGYTTRIPLETYYRFLVSKYLPETETRAIWMDVDLVVNRSISDFYYQDFCGHYLAGCRDIGDHREKLEKLGCPRESEYINAGVILFDVEKMRQYQLADYYNYYAANEEVITWFDQDVINGIFAGRIKVWDCDEYNVQVSNWRFRNQYDLEKAAVIHYIGESKPWFNTYTNEAAKMWDRYHALTFSCPEKYLQERRIHRWMQKKIWIPFGTFRSKLYEKSKTIHMLRDMVRGKHHA